LLLFLRLLLLISVLSLTFFLLFFARWGCEWDRDKLEVKFDDGDLKDDDDDDNEGDGDAEKLKNDLGWVDFFLRCC
jgi:hypothetical protein